MRYKIGKEYQMEIDLETDSVMDVLLAIARTSYETANPRGLGFKQPYLHIVENTPSFEEWITRDGKEPTMLFMSYINGRDCRTKVYKKEEKWYLDGYAFQQRKVDLEQFFSGKIEDPADKFLDKVIERLMQERS